MNEFFVIGTLVAELRSPVGPRRLGTATRISASLSGRLSAFFESTSRPRPKSGKVCRSDTRAGDVCERAERSEGSDTTLIRKGPCFAVCALVCDLSSRAGCVYPFLPMKANVSRLWEKLKDAMKSGWGIKFIAAALPDFSRLLVLWVHREPGNVCI